MNVSHRNVEILDNFVPISKNSTNLVTVDTTTGGTTIVDSNQLRVGIIIQNQGTNPVLLSFGEDTSTTNYSLILPGASGVRLGDGGAFSDMDNNWIWKGSIKGIVESGSSIVSILEKTKTG